MGRGCARQQPPAGGDSKSEARNSKSETNPKSKALRNYLKTLNVIAKSAATRQSESLAWEIASLRSQ
jgi:hypothetical protein